MKKLNPLNMLDRNMFDMSDLNESFFVGQNVKYLTEENLNEGRIINKSTKNPNKLLISPAGHNRKPVLVDIKNVFYDDTKPFDFLSKEQLNKYYPDSFDEPGWAWYYHGSPFEYLDSVATNGLCGQLRRQSFTSGHDKKTPEYHNPRFVQRNFENNMSRMLGRLKTYKTLYPEQLLDQEELKEIGRNIHTAITDRNLMGLRNYFFTTRDFYTASKYANKGIGNYFSLIYRFKFKGRCFADYQQSHAYITSTHVPPSNIEFLLIDGRNEELIRAFSMIQDDKTIEQELKGGFMQLNAENVLGAKQYKAEQEGYYNEIDSMKNL